MMKTIAAHTLWLGRPLLTVTTLLATLGISAEPSTPEWPQVYRCGHVVQPEDLGR